MALFRPSSPGIRRGHGLIVALIVAASVVSCGSDDTHDQSGAARPGLGESASGPERADTTPISRPRTTTTTRPTTTTTRPTACQVGMPLSNTTTLTTGGAAAGRAVNRNGVGLMIGHSNGAAIFPEFIRQARQVSDFRWVMAAQPGEDSKAWASTDKPWNNAATRLQAAGRTPADVQVVFGVLSRRMTDPRATTPLDAYHDQDLPAIMRRIEATYPNVRLVYIEARESGRFAVGGTNGEPGAYLHTQRAVDFAANYQGRATVIVGPYLWDDGRCFRTDGLRTLRADFQSDGLHPSTAGAAKFATAMVAYFRTHPSAAPWFPRR